MKGILTEVGRQWWFKYSMRSVISAIGNGCIKGNDFNGDKNDTMLKMGINDRSVGNIFEDVKNSNIYCGKCTKISL